mgnify:CR=1 FL=1
MRNLSSVSEVKEILKESGFRFSKSLGQNFLVDENVLSDIINGACITKDTNVIEIGPGFGTLTQQLCLNAKKVVAVEIDSTVIPVLKQNTAEFNNLSVINADILKTDINKLVENEFGGGTVKIAANLPYYITTPIIMGLIEQELPISDIVVMIQKEVADRIAAKPSAKDYGALTVAVNFYSVPQIIVNVPPSSFIPQPKVSSSVIKLQMRDKPPVDVKDKKMFFKVVKASFGQRRKTLLNALSNSPSFAMGKDEISKMLESISIDGRRRGETLNMDEFANIANNIR